MLRKVKVVGHDKLKACYHGLKRAVLVTLREVSVKMIHLHEVTNGSFGFIHSDECEMWLSGSCK